MRAWVLGIALATGALWLALVRPATGAVIAMKMTGLAVSPAEEVAELETPCRAALSRSRLLPPSPWRRAGLSRSRRGDRGAH